MFVSICELLPSLSILFPLWVGGGGSERAAIDCQFRLNQNTSRTSKTATICSQFQMYIDSSQNQPPSCNLNSLYSKDKAFNWSGWVNRSHYIVKTPEVYKLFLACCMLCNVAIKYITLTRKGKNSLGNKHEHLADSVESPALQCTQWEFRQLVIFLIAK